MPIEVTCPTCSRAYKVKEEAAGKKLRCKGCETVIPIPDAVDIVDEEDPWDGLDEQDQPALPPARVSRPKARPKSSGGGSSSGMPPTIIGSLVLCAITIVVALLGVAGMIVTGDFRKVIAAGIRILVAGVIMKGLLDRRDRIRRNAIMLDCLGLGLLGLCVTPALLFANQQAAIVEKMDAGSMTLAMVGLGFQMLIWIVDLVLLLSPSAKSYTNQ